MFVFLFLALTRQATYLGAFGALSYDLSPSFPSVEEAEEGVYSHHGSAERDPQVAVAVYKS